MWRERREAEGTEKTAKGGHTHLVDTLVRQGADVWRRRKSDGKTALEVATVNNGKKELVELLQVARGAATPA